MKNIFAFLIAPLLVVAVAGCTKAQTSNITNEAGQLCSVIFQAADPQLAPLCTTAVEIAQAIEALVGGDAGVGAEKPSDAAIYAWLLAHGARPIAH